VAELSSIPYAGLAVVCLVYDRARVQHALDGFGFLVPRGQDARMLGCIWSGSIFPDHAADGRVLLRVMVGGARDPEGVQMDDGQLVELVHSQLDRMLGGIEGGPRGFRVYRHPRAIPQYVRGHADLLDRLWRELQQSPGLYLAGNAYRGVGVNDCVREARALAREIAGVEKKGEIGIPRAAAAG
jgi:oxygen-dependent protoporphyrinogen oxidase